MVSVPRIEAEGGLCRCSLAVGREVVVGNHLLRDGN